ncbi:hypothetical protein [Streptomyces noursei]|uniref:hypothetical protein n=1 Tax=Streptomyces noursei TaxID=1971 RepID=UPI001962791B|nr:hypothetical protein [Streptomyces noursei]QRX89941.1 hypothetical protein JNO44_02870 [Streptomyces noursei]
MKSPSPADEETLLTYTCTTVPEHVYASPPDGELSLCDLRITVTNHHTEPVYCALLTIRLPVGAGAPQLVASGSGITPLAVPATWSVVALQEDVLIAVPQDGMARFTPTEHALRQTVTPSLAIELKGLRISREPGTAVVEALESAANTPEGPPSERTRSFEIVKRGLGLATAGLAEEV